MAIKGRVALIFLLTRDQSEELYGPVCVLIPRVQLARAKLARAKLAGSRGAPGDVALISADASLMHVSFMLLCRIFASLAVFNNSGSSIPDPFSLFDRYSYFYSLVIRIILLFIIYFIIGPRQVAIGGSAPLTTRSLKREKPDRASAPESVPRLIRLLLFPDAEFLLFTF